MKYKDKVANLLGLVENKLTNLKGSVESNMLSKDDAVRLIEALQKDVEYTVSLIDLEDRDFPA